MKQSVLTLLFETLPKVLDILTNLGKPSGRVGSFYLRRFGTVGLPSLVRLVGLLRGEILPVTLRLGFFCGDQYYLSLVRRNFANTFPTLMQEGKQSLPLNQGTGGQDLI